MALEDVLPDRPLTFDEFQDIQAQDTFDSVTTAETREIEYLFLRKGEKEYGLHYCERGWHRLDDGDESHE